MAGEIDRAVEALNQRKMAVLDGQLHGAVGNAELLAILSGFDLDAAEVIDAAEFATQHGAHAMVFAIKTGSNPSQAFASIWIDGLAMGLLIAQERERAEAAK